MLGSILVIEDDLDLQEMYRDILTHNGYSVETASDGEEGLKKYKKMKIDLVIMDSDMPKMNGYQTFAKIKEFDKNANVVMITGYSEKDLKFEDSIKNGLRSVITKPIGLGEILRIARKYS